jgi:poly(3-hydroxybutyrate) depolymerase
MELQVNSRRIPDSFVAGFSNGGDLFSAVGCTVEQLGNTAAFAVDTVGDVLKWLPMVLDCQSTMWQLQLQQTFKSTTPT